MTFPNPTTTCPRHIPVPSTNATARDHTPRATHGAHHPNGSPGAGPATDVTTRSMTTRHHQRMPWQNDRPRSRRYGREHRATREAHMTALRAAGAGLCAERVCVMRTRIITPDMDLDLCHDETGTVVLGLGHSKCNRHEAAVRARRLQTQPTRTRRHSQLRW